MRTGRLRRSAGYTLIELSLVVVVTGLVSSIVVLRLGPSLEHARVRSAANVIAGDLQYAQTMSVRNRRPVAVLALASTRQILIRDRDDPTQVFRTRSLGPGTDFGMEQLIAVPSSVELFPNGVVRTTMTLTVGIGSFRRRVRITKAGQIRVLR